VIEVRSYVLTKRERRILKRFIKTGEKLDGFAVLIHHLKKNRENISGDLKMVEDSLRKICSDEFDEVADEALKQAEDKKKTRLRTRGPYRKADIRTR
jgi:hypothetical protein